jgi:hypothetical protein
MYEPRQTVGVLPSCSATLLTALTMFFLINFSSSQQPISANSIAARSVPPHVRKSLAENSGAVMVFR